MKGKWRKSLFLISQAYPLKKQATLLAELPRRRSLTEAAALADLVEWLYSAVANKHTMTGYRSFCGQFAHSGFNTCSQTDFLKVKSPQSGVADAVANVHSMHLVTNSR